MDRPPCRSLGSLCRWAYRSVLDNGRRLILLSGLAPKASSSALKERQLESYGRSALGAAEWQQQRTCQLAHHQAFETSSVAAAEETCID
jgi:hypothetical protein